MKRTKGRILSDDEIAKIKKDYSEGIGVLRLCKLHKIGTDKVYKIIKNQRVQGDDLEERQLALEKRMEEMEKAVEKRVEGLEKALNQTVSNINLVIREMREEKEARERIPRTIRVVKEPQKRGWF